MKRNAGEIDYRSPQSQEGKGTINLSDGHLVPKDGETTYPCDFLWASGSGPLAFVQGFELWAPVVYVVDNGVIIAL